jgi:hypothetical protein
MSKRQPEESNFRSLNFHELKAEFIATEIELATTFCQLAQSSRESEKVRQHVQNARRAYQTVCHLMTRNSPPRAARQGSF